MNEWMVPDPLFTPYPNSKFPDVTVTQENLKPEYDAATKEYGNDCMIPTVEDYNELCQNSDLEFIQLNGVNCIKVISKINGESIIIPLAGCFDEFTPGVCSYEGEVGSTWASTHYSDVDNFGGQYSDSAYQVMWSEYRGIADAMTMPFPMNIAQSIRPIKRINK